jgi:hypothetical protein
MTRAIGQAAFPPSSQPFSRSPQAAFPRIGSAMNGKRVSASIKFFLLERRFVNRVSEEQDSPRLKLVCENTFHCPATDAVNLRREVRNPSRRAHSRLSPPVGYFFGSLLEQGLKPRLR